MHSFKIVYLILLAVLSTKSYAFQISQTDNLAPHCRVFFNFGGGVEIEIKDQFEREGYRVSKSPMNADFVVESGNELLTDQGILGLPGEGYENRLLINLKNSSGDILESKQIGHYHMSKKEHDGEFYVHTRLPQNASECEKKAMAGSDRSPRHILVSYDVSPERTQRIALKLARRACQSFQN